MHAQNWSNWHKKNISIQSDTTQIDTLSIIPNSVYLYDINGAFIPPNQYQLLPFSSSIVWNHEFPADSISIVYRTYPVLFSRKEYHYKYATYDSISKETGFLISTRSFYDDNASNLIDFGRLNYSGNFSRGISFGNAQSLNLNSSFNLQLGGQITDDIEILAAITDNNIPIQPQGNTAQLQEFDKVYVQLKKDAHTLTVGDFDAGSRDGYFMKFQRNLQGISYAGNQPVPDIGNVSGMASFAIARGKFAVNTLIAEEGNQGPYKLSGSNNELFIIVIAGSERVYINGELMERGANKDYTIDYNLGEITFTPNRIITQDLRIRVEFQYADRNYFRSLLHVNAAFEHPKVKTTVHFFSEQDAKNQPINIDLDEEKESILTAIGDSIQNAFFSGATVQEFDESRILYAKKDTTYNGIIDTVFVYSPNPNEVLYSVLFSFVGEGNGNYVPEESIANGRVFSWIQPNADNSLNGSYEPVILLSTPKKSQLLTAAIDYKATEHTMLRSELSLSNQDVNTFSEIDDNDNIGFAAMFAAQHNQFIHKEKDKRVYAEANYEFKQDQFIPIERYREVEFSRNWNLIDHTVLYNEHLGSVKAGYASSNKQEWYYLFSFFKQDSLYRGFQHELGGAVNSNRVQLNTNTRYLSSEDPIQKTLFLRPKFDVSYQMTRLNNWRIGVGSYHELNRITDIHSDSLLNTSFLWQEYKGYVETPDSAKNNFKLTYTLRYQHLPDVQSFQSPYFTSQTIDFQGNMISRKNHALHWVFTYRNVQQDTLINTDDNLEHFYLGRIHYSFSGLKGAIRGSSLYEIGAGREQKIQYTYVEAPDGVGSFAWDDINENGIQELNEFYVSAFQNENRFIRLFSNTLEFQPVNSTRFNQTLHITPRAVWYTTSGIKKFISRFSSSTTIQLSNKVFADNQVRAVDVLSPVTLNVDDTLLVSENTSIRQVLFFNRTNSSYGFEYTLQFNDSKSLLTSGFEKKSFMTQSVQFRWNISTSATTRLKYTNGYKKNDSDFFFDRKYEYITNEFEGEVSYIADSKLKTELRYFYSFRSNPLAELGGQFSVRNQLTAALKYSRIQKSTFSVEISYASVGYNDTQFTNEQLEFDMLQGFQNGNNYTWTANFDRILAKNLQISLIYDGRKTGENTDIVHTGRAQIRAVF